MPREIELKYTVGVDKASQGIHVTVTLDCLEQALDGILGPTYTRTPRHQQRDEYGKPEGTTDVWRIRRVHGKPTLFTRKVRDRGVLYDREETENVVPDDLAFREEEVVGHILKAVSTWYHTDLGIEISAYVVENQGDNMLTLYLEIEGPRLDYLQDIAHHIKMAARVILTPEMLSNYERYIGGV